MDRAKPTIIRFRPLVPINKGRKPDTPPSNRGIKAQERRRREASQKRLFNDFAKITKEFLSWEQLERRIRICLCLEAKSSGYSVPSLQF